MSKEEEKVEENNNNNEEVKEEKADNVSETEEKQEKYINPELLNDDLEESIKVEKIAQEIKPYFSSNILPRSLYLQKTVLPLVYEALNQTEKMRPKDPIEVFAGYLLDRNKKEIQ